MPKGVYERLAEHPHNWKGQCASYSAIHRWVKSKLGNPKLCEKCGTTNAKTYQWSNISGLYHRDLKDYERLCILCHKKKDIVSFPRGQDHHNTNLTNEDVAKIRSMYPRTTYKKIGLMFRTSGATVGRIVRREFWKHI